MWTSRGFYAFWGPGVGAICGGLAGGLVYDVFLYTGGESFVNRPSGGRRNPRIEQAVDDGEA